MRSLLLLAAVIVAALCVHAMPTKRDHSQCCAVGVHALVDERFVQETAAHINRCLLRSCAVSSEAVTALQTYVAAPDANFAWEHIEGADATAIGFKIQVLNMTSQRWLTDADVSRSIWSVPRLPLQDRDRATPRSSGERNKQRNNELIQNMCVCVCLS